MRSCRQQGAAGSAWAAASTLAAAAPAARLQLAAAAAHTQLPCLPVAATAAQQLISLRGFRGSRVQQALGVVDKLHEEAHAVVVPAEGKPR
mgnify:CR=1 FL=1